MPGYHSDDQLPVTSPATATNLHGFGRRTVADVAGRTVGLAYRGLVPMCKGTYDIQALPDSPSLVTLDW